MTRTYKQKSVVEIVAGENEYQRAAAIWVARRVEGNPDRIYDVDFGVDPGGGCPTCDMGPQATITYTDNGRGREIFLDDYRITPGKFVEECVAILEEMRS